MARTRDDDAHAARTDGDVVLFLTGRVPYSLRSALYAAFRARGEAERGEEAWVRDSTMYFKRLRVPVGAAGGGGGGGTHALLCEVDTHTHVGAEEMPVPDLILYCVSAIYRGGSLAERQECVELCRARAPAAPVVMLVKDVHASHDETIVSRQREMARQLGFESWEAECSDKDPSSVRAVIEQAVRMARGEPTAAVAESAATAPATNPQPKPATIAATATKPTLGVNQDAVAPAESRRTTPQPPDDEEKEDREQGSTIEAVFGMEVAAGVDLDTATLLVSGDGGTAFLRACATLRGHQPGPNPTTCTVPVLRPRHASSDKDSDGKASPLATRVKVVVVVEGDQDTEAEERQDVDVACICLPVPRPAAGPGNGTGENAAVAAASSPTSAGGGRTVVSELQFRDRIGELRASYPSHIPTFVLRLTTRDDIPEAESEMWSRLVRTSGIESWRLAWSGQAMHTDAVQAAIEAAAVFACAQRLATAATTEELGDRPREPEAFSMERPAEPVNPQPAPQVGAHLKSMLEEENAKRRRARAAWQRRQDSYELEVMCWREASISWAECFGDHFFMALQDMDQVAASARAVAREKARTRGRSSSLQSPHSRSLDVYAL